VVSCALQERADLAWWQPVHAISKSSELGVYNASRAPSFSGGVFQGVDGGVCGRQGSTDDEDEDKEGNGGKPRSTSVSWLPLAVCIAADPEAWLVHVAEGATPEEAEAALSTEATSESNSAMAARATYSLTAVVAHVVDQDEAAEAGPDYEGHMVAHIKVPQTYFAAQTESPIVSRPSSRGKGRDADALQSLAAAAAADAAADAMSHIEEGKKRDVPQRDVVDDEVDGDGGGGDFGEHEEENKQTPVDFDGDAVGSTEQVDVAVLNAATPDKTAHNDFAARSHRAAKENTSTRREGWMVFNDFHITPCLPQEVLELYGGQKAPALLFFTRIDVETAAAAAVPASPTPVLSPDAFLSLCRAPPIQSNTAHLRRPAFVPLRADELPKPGTLLALDAEFVAYSPPERTIRCGLEVEARPSRLGLGRVSIVRGEGPLAGVPCIDDYIRSVEPVYDHLTRFSGLVPGDLDPSRSRHYLTTLRKAYLKLRFLVDAGVVFVGHGLKKDFRMLNIVVPPEQMVDTLDLFYTGRGRRVSLRFLSAYLLGSAIQSGTHDSVEDATTALRLYQTYRALVAEGKFETVLTEMFEWGATAGWDPDTWQNSPPYLTASMQQVTEGAGMGRAPGETAGFQNATPEGALQRLEAMQQQLATQRRNE
jgi:PAB-dependent poly(A)-specific ribonuclease subunit 2